MRCHKIDADCRAFDVALPLTFADILLFILTRMDAHMVPEDRREPIFELAEKFRFLQENHFSRSQCGHAASENSFCDKLGIPRNTIWASLEKGGLTSEHQRVLADKCEFSLDWPEWNDPKADRNAKGDARRDTCEGFKARYLEHHSKEEPESDPPSAIPVPLKEDLWAETLSGETALASLSLRTGQSAPVPGEAMLSFDLNCPKCAADGVMTGVKQGILTFRCGYGFTTDARDRTGYPGGVEFNGAKLTPLSVDKKEPSWLVTTTAAAAIGLIGDAPQDFIRIVNLTPGASVSADFTACVRDIATTFVLPDGQNQSAAKQKIKKRLRELKLSGGEEGIAKLAVAEIRFAARED